MKVGDTVKTVDNGFEISAKVTRVVSDKIVDVSIQRAADGRGRVPDPFTRSNLALKEDDGPLHEGQWSAK